MPVRHFLSLMDLDQGEIKHILARAIEMKSQLRHGQATELLRHRTAVMEFEKSSTRTRVSFETGITHLGGNAIFLAPSDSHLGRGEPISDTAKILSGMASLIIMRTGAHERVEEMAAAASVPVINGLSDFNHPCQLLADMQTWIEHRGSVEGKIATWIGDGNNVCHSWMNAARQLGFTLRIACPENYYPDSELIALCGDAVKFFDSPIEAAADSNLIVTDTWASMGQEHEKSERNSEFEGYRVDQSIMHAADNEAIFMHCLPAYRGLEVSSDVIDGKQSVVWDEAENRLHAQKALMEFLLTDH